MRSHVSKQVRTPFALPCKSRLTWNLPACARDAPPCQRLLHVHGRGHEALAAGDVGCQWLVTGGLQVVALVQDRGGAAVQGSGGFVVQVL